MNKKKAPLRVDELLKLKDSNSNKTNKTNNTKENMQQVIDNNLWVLVNAGENSVRFQKFTGNETDIFMLISEKTKKRALASAQRNADMKGVTLLPEQQ